MRALDVIAQECDTAVMSPAPEPPCTHWECALMGSVCVESGAPAMMPAPISRNRRAHTSGLPVRDNRIFEIRIMRDGYHIARTTAYYRRIASPSYRYTGPAPVGSVHGHYTAR